MISDFAETVRRLHDEGEYRPVGVAVIFREVSFGREYLLVRSAKWTTDWLFPQGGADPGESLEENLSRELSEELGISLDPDIEVVSAGYHNETLDYEATRTIRRGFSRGKAYIFTLCQYLGDRDFVLQQDEVAEAGWFGRQDAVCKLYEGRQEKAAVAERALVMSERIIEAKNSMYDEVVSVKQDDLRYPYRYSPEDFSCGDRVRLYLGWRTNQDIQIREGTVTDTEKMKSVGFEREPAIDILVKRAGMLERREPRIAAAVNANGYTVWGNPVTEAVQKEYQRRFFYHCICRADRAK